MKLDRIANAKRNIFFGFLNKIITLLYPFVIRTIFIKEIGAEFSGLYSLFASILQVLNLTELGFSSAIVFSLYKPIAQDDTEAICAILNFFRKTYYIISVLILVAGFAIMPFLPKMIKGSPPDGINIYILYLIYLFSTSFSYAFISYKQVILLAYQRNDWLSNIATITNIIVYTLQLFIIYCTRNFYLFALTSFLSIILNNSSVAVITKRLFPNLICKGTLKQELKADIKEKVSGLMIGKVSGISRNALDSIFLSAFLGLVETAIYNNYYLIMNSVTGFILIIYGSIVAGIGNSVATESVEKNYNDLQIMNFIYMWLSGWCAICLLCLYQPFTELLFGKDMLFPFSTVIAFCCYFYILKTGDIICLYSEANGLYWKRRYVAITEAVCNIFLNFILGKYFGALGIVSATTLSLLLTTNSWGAFIVFKNYFVKEKISHYFYSHLFYLTLTIITGLITLIICRQITSVSFLSFLIKMIICIFVPNILYYIFYCRTNIFRKSLAFLKKIIHL